MTRNLTTQTLPGHSVQSRSFQLQFHSVQHHQSLFSRSKNMSDFVSLVLIHFSVCFPPFFNLKNGQNYFWTFLYREDDGSFPVLFINEINRFLRSKEGESEVYPSYWFLVVVPTSNIVSLILKNLYYCIFPRNGLSGEEIDDFFDDQ